MSWDDWDKKYKVILVVIGVISGIVVSFGSIFFAILRCCSTEEKYKQIMGTCKCWGKKSKQDVAGEIGKEGDKNVTSGVNFTCHGPVTINNVAGNLERQALVQPTQIPEENRQDDLGERIDTEESETHALIHSPVPGCSASSSSSTNRNSYQDEVEGKEDDEAGQSVSLNISASLTTPANGNIQQDLKAKGDDDSDCTKPCPSKVPDFYVHSDELEWEERIFQKLQNMGHLGYYRNKFPLGGLKSKARLNGVKKCRVLIVGFVSPSEMKTPKADIATYIAALGQEYWNQEKFVICVPVSSDAVVPEDFIAFSQDYNGNEDDFCANISDSLNNMSALGHAASVNTAASLSTQTNRTSQQHEVEAKGDDNTDGNINKQDELEEQ